MRCSSPSSTGAPRHGPTPHASWACASLRPSRPSSWRTLLVALALVMPNEINYRVTTTPWCAPRSGWRAPGRLVLAIVAGIAFAAVAERAGGIGAGTRRLPRIGSAGLAQILLGTLVHVAFLGLATLLLGVLWTPIGEQLASGEIDAATGLLLVGFVAIWLCLVLAAERCTRGRPPRGRDCSRPTRDRHDRGGPEAAVEDLGTQLELTLRLRWPSCSAPPSARNESSSACRGFRTHALVSLGSALFTVISAYAFTGPGSDPTRIAAQVVSGIGFLGGGAILHYGGTVRGLTTAASLWSVAGVGMAAGAGMFVVAALAPCW